MSRIRTHLRRAVCFISLTAIMATVILTVPRTTSAASDNDVVIMEKAMIAGVYHCMSSTYLNDEVYLGEHDLAYEDNFKEAIFTKKGRKSDEDSVKLPTQIGNTIKDSAVGCSELLLGYNGIGKNDLTGFGLPKNVTRAGRWMEALGYIKTASAETGTGTSNNKCIQVQYDITEGSSLAQQKTDEVCFELDDKGRFKKENNQLLITPSSTNKATSGNILTLQQYGPTNMIEITSNCQDKKGNACPDSSKFWPTGIGGDITKTTLEDFKAYLESLEINSVDYKGFCTKGSKTYCKEHADVQNITLSIRDEDQQEVVENSNYYKLSLSPSDRREAAESEARTFFTNGKYADAAAASFNNADRYTDYIYTLFKLFGISTDSAAGCGSKSDLNNSDLALKLISTKGTTMYVQINEKSLTDAKDKKLLTNVSGKSDGSLKGMAYVVDPQNSAITSDPVDIDTIIQYLDTLDHSIMDMNGLTAVNPETCIVDGVPDMPTDYTPENEQTAEDANSDDAEDKNAPCYKHAGAMGWLLCPVVIAIGDVMDDVYGWIEQTFLQVSPIFLERGGGTYKAWAAFRDIANIAFAAILLVVILSQVTGFGIDNYGIKRILPRLVISIILVNLSFIICALMADLSNIFGNSLNKMLSNSFDLEGGAGAGIGSVLTSGVTTFALGAAGVAAAFFISPGLIITVLLFLLSGLIAIFFLYIILVSRQAALIMGIAIAPLAFICYMLPNTEKWFNKWISAMAGLLLLYPICGLVVGGGQFAGTLLSSAAAEAALDNAGEKDSIIRALNLAAMLIQVIPYFFIPSLLKSSMRAIGDIGNKISNFGRVLDRNTVGRLRDSDLVKDKQTRMNAGMDKNGKLTGFGEWRSDIASRTGFGRNSIARSQAAVLKQRDERRDAQAALIGALTDAEEARDPSKVTQDSFQKRLNEASRKGKEDDYYALLDESVRRFGASKAADMHRKSSEVTYGEGLMSAERSAGFQREAYKRYGSIFQPKDYALGKWMQMGGIGQNGSRMRLTVFENPASGNIPIGDIKDEQAATLSAASLERGMDGGYVTAAMAHRVMANPELRKAMDDVQQLQWAMLDKYGVKMKKEDAEKLLQGKISSYALANGGSVSTDDANNMISLNAQNVIINDVDLHGNPQTDTLKVDHSQPNPPASNP